MKTAAVFLSLLLVASTAFAARDLKGVKLTQTSLLSSTGLLSGLSNPLGLLNLQNIDNLIKFGTSPSGGITVTLDTSAVAALKLPVNIVDALNNIVALVTGLLDGITVSLTGAVDGAVGSVTDLLSPITSLDLQNILTPANFLSTVVPLQNTLLPLSVSKKVNYKLFSTALKEFNKKPANRVKPASDAIQTVYANILSGLSSSPNSLLNGLLGQIPVVDKLLSVLSGLLSSLLGPNGLVGGLLGGVTGTATNSGLNLESSVSALIMPLSMLLSGLLGNVLNLGDVLGNLGGLGLPVLG